MNIEQKINKVLDNIRPYLLSDGGDVKFVKYENGKVFIKMSGACLNCSLIDYTIKDGIEAMLINEIPGVVEVVLVND